MPSPRKQKPVRKAKVQASSASSLGKVGVLRWGFIFGTTVGLLGLFSFVAYNKYWVTDRKMSHILKELIDFGVHQQALDVQVDSLLIADPFADIVKAQLQPIQDKIASLNTQARMYEEMEQIPGGPTNFIDTALRDLTELSKDHLDKVNKEGLSLLPEKVRTAKSLQSALNSLLPKHLAGVDDESLIRLIQHNILIAEPDPSTQNTKTYDEVLAMFGSLAELFSRMESRVDKVKDMLGQAGIRDDEEFAERSTDNIQQILAADIEQLNSMKEGILKEIDKNGKYYRLLSGFRTGLVQKLMRNSERLQNYETDTRETYLKLIQLVLEDIRKTRSRIFNLRRRSKPKKVEL